MNTDTLSKKRIVMLNSVLRNALIGKDTSTLTLIVMELTPRLRQDVWRYLNSSAEPWLKKSYHSEYRMELTNSATIRLIDSNNPEMLRGLRADMVLLDGKVSSETEMLARCSVRA